MIEGGVGRPGVATPRRSARLVRQRLQLLRLDLGAVLGANQVAHLRRDAVDGPVGAGAAYRHALVWNPRTRLGIDMEQYGPVCGLTRIVGMPEALAARRSKRRKTIAKSRGPESIRFRRRRPHAGIGDGER